MIAQKANPLQFFIDFIRYKGFDLFKSNFFEEKNYTLLHSIDLKKEIVTYYIPKQHDKDVMVVKQFREALEQMILVKTTDTLKNIDNLIFNEPNYFLRVQKEIDVLLKELELYNEANKYPIISQQLSTIKNRLIESHGDTKSKQISPANVRLQWMGNINQLTTLLEDLTTEYKLKNGDPVLKGSIADIKKFILNNFLDKDGKEINEKSLHKYFDSGSPEKRAKTGVKILLNPKSFKPKKAI